MNAAITIDGRGHEMPKHQGSKCDMLDGGTRPCDWHTSNAALSIDERDHEMPKHPGLNYDMLDGRTRS